MSGVLTPGQIQELRRKHYNATLIHMRKFHPELAVMRVKPDFALPPHKPGHYTTLGLGYWEPRAPDCQEENLALADEDKMVRRAYSIAHPLLDDQGRLAPTANPEWLEFYVVLIRDSVPAKPPALTPRLFMLTQGDRLYLGERITGNFTLDPVKPEDTVLFLSTGTGEAPHNYMLAELLQRNHQGRLLAACCVRFRQDLAYLPVHEELMRRYPHYTYLSLTTREVDTIKNKVYIQELITSGQLEQRLGQRLDPARTHVFLCGNPKMIGVPTKDRETGQRTYPKPLGIVEILEQRGFQADQPQIKFKGNIHFEEYW